MRGDSKIQLEVERTGGSFDPRADAYSPIGSDIRHDDGSFERMGEVAIKTVTLPFLSDDPLIAVSAHGGSGSGSFELTVRCLSGSCAGNEPNEADPWHASICLENARECLFRQSPAEGEGENVLATCLQASTGVDGSCATACDADEDSKQVCELMASAAESLSSEGDDCVEVLGGCLDECLLREENSGFLDDGEPTFYNTGTARCWLDPNSFGSCYDYSLDNFDCNGDQHNDAAWSYGSCFHYCEAFAGPWQSDVDETCDEYCYYGVCELLFEDCEFRCDGDGDPDACLESCVTDDVRNDTHTGTSCWDFH